MATIIEKKKIVRKDVVELILNGLGVTNIKKYEVDSMVRLFFDIIQTAMEENCKVELRGFGSFSVETLKATIKTVPASKLRHPNKKYLEISVKERKTIKFKPSIFFKRILNPEQLSN